MMGMLGGNHMLAQEPSFGSSRSKAALVDEVKKIQRSSPDNKEQWYSYCRTQGTSSYDPERHDEEFLNNFLASLRTGQPPMQATLVMKVKAFQRSSQENKDLWYKFCQMNGSPDFDPNRHDEAFLRNFLDNVDSGQFAASLCGKGGKTHPVNIEVSDKIFVGGLPKIITDEQVKNHFSQFGIVKDVNMKFDEKGACRGFCFVTFDSVDTAQVVLDNYDNNTIDGKWIECKAAMPQEKGTSKGKSKGKSWEDDYGYSWGGGWGDLMGGCGGNCWGGWGNPWDSWGWGDGSWGFPPWHMQMMMGKGMMGKGMMGNGMMSNGMMGNGMMGMGMMGKAMPRMGCSNASAMGWPDMRGRGGKGCKGDTSALGNKIFAGALPKKCGQEMIMEYFSQFGTVVNVELKYGPDGTFRGFGFITFESTDSVQAVLDNYDNNMIEGKWIDCKTAAQQEASLGRQVAQPGAQANVRPPDGFTLRMRGLPFQASLREILAFFGDYTPVRIMTIADAQGRPSGEALVEFADADACAAAFTGKQGESLGHRYIELFGATEDDMSRIVALQTWSINDDFPGRGAMRGYGPTMGMGMAPSAMRSAPY